MEVLGQKIQKAVEDGSWKACQLGKGGPRVSHLFFADDLLLVGEAIEMQVGLLKAFWNASAGVQDKRRVKTNQGSGILQIRQ